MKRQTNKDRRGALADLLLSLDPKVRPDDVSAFYSAEGVQLNIQTLEPKDNEDKPLGLIEGDRRALLFLADLLLAQASDPLDCGFQILLPARTLLGKRSRYGLYIHALPCPHGEKQADSPKP